jgi:hypothetical protein
MGKRESLRKGKRYEEIFGIEKAKEMKLKMSKVRKEGIAEGRIEVWNKGKKCLYLTKRNLINNPIHNLIYREKAAQKRREGFKNGKIIAWNKGRTHKTDSRIIAGKEHPNWQGGKISKNKLIRVSQEYKLWRTKVFKRDNYTCQSCNNYGVFLHPHHRKPLALYPNLAFDVDNGETLCKLCHLEKGLHLNILKR